MQAPSPVQLLAQLLVEIDHTGLEDRLLYYQRNEHERKRLLHNLMHIQ